MKPTHLLTILFYFLLSPKFTNAQHGFPVAVSTDGIIVGKYKTANDATNPIPDTISVDQARTIFALNVLDLKREYKPMELKVRDFQMTTIYTDETISFQTEGSMLSEEMKSHLQNIKPGTKLVFEGIYALHLHNETSSIIILLLTVY